MRKCISSTCFSVLVNGTPSRPFRASRGLRQGDPLSPFLFTLVTEALGVSFMGLISGFGAGRGGEVATHFQFADDTILFLMKL